MTISEEAFEREWGPRIDPHEDPRSASLIWEYEHTLDQPTHHVWSLVDGDDGGTYAIAGYHVVNVFGYAVTSRAWETGEEEAVWSEPLTPEEVTEAEAIDALADATHAGQFGGWSE